LALLGLALQGAEVGAQERPKIEIVPLIAHAGTVNSAAFSRDGAFVLTGGDDGTLKLWDMVSARLVRTFAGHKGKVLHVALSPDGTRALSGGEDKTIRLWEVATGRLVRTIYAHLDATGGEVSSVAFSPDGKRLLSGSRGESAAKLWDAETGRLVRIFQHAKGSLRAGVTSALFSPDGAQIATGGAGDKIVNVWNTETGQLLQAFGEAPPAFIYRVKLAFSPDGARILAGDNTSLKLWNTAKGTLIHTLAFQDAGKSPGGPALTGVALVAFSTDGSFALSSDPQNGLQFWSPETGQLVRTVKPRFENLIAVSPDNARALLDEFGNRLKVQDLASEQFIRTFEGHSSSVTSVAASPDGTRFLTSGDKVRLWDSASGRLERTIEERSPRSVVFSPDGSRLLAGSFGSLDLWDVGSGQLVRGLKTGSAEHVAFSADGTRLLSASRDGAIAEWEADSGRPVQGFEVKPKKDKTYVDLLAFSPDGSWLFCKDGYEEPLKLWNAEARQVAHTFAARPTNFVQSAAFFPPGGQAALGYFDGALKVWEAVSGRLVRTFWHSKSVNAAAFSGDGSKLLSGSTDGTVKLWDNAAGQLLRTFEGHASTVRSVAFSPGEKRVISGSNDTTARVWDPATGEQLVLLLTAGDEWLAITPEGFFDSSSKGAEMLTVVRGLEVYSIDQFYQALYRPDLLREKLAGDPNGKVKDAAARLDLAKLVDSGRAPKVVIVSHNVQDVSPADFITVEARVVDQGGGIGRAEWRINGITVGVAEQTAGPAGRTISLKQAMALDPGENIIELIAYNGANLVASAPARAGITWNGAEPTAPPRLHVLVVGINDYLDADLRLTYAVPDAKALAAALGVAGQGLYEEVNVTHVLDGDATAARLDEAFNRLAAKVRPRDVFVFFAAGHGKTLDGRYYFIPYDLRYHTDKSFVRDAIGQDRLQAWFARILAKKAVLMFDTCEAGSLTERAKTRGGLEQKTALGRLIQATGRATLTASSATQEAYEGYGGHGVFTFALLDALARGDLNNNGLVELAELIEHVDGLVPAITEKRWGAKQFPQMDAYGSNFPLARQVAALALDPGDAIIIPVKPTHVNTELLQVYKETGGTGGIVQQLPPFTPVTLVKSDRGWVLVAKDGKLLGYTAETKLHKLN
jgi:WD40 repeat protein